MVTSSNFGDGHRVKVFNAEEEEKPARTVKLESNFRRDVEQNELTDNHREKREERD